MSEQGAPDNDQYGPPVPDGSEDAEMGADGADANGPSCCSHTSWRTALSRGSFHDPVYA